MATTTAPLQRRSNRRAFMIAAVFGLMAAFLTVTYLKGARSDDSPKSVATVPVVVALRDIPERTVIKEGMVEVKQVAVDARHNLALPEKAQAVGQTTRVPIAS